MSFGFGFGLTKITKITAATIAAFSPSSLFAANEPGVWYDPSDFSTLFQDAAGTVPVTAVEQPVGRILDKSGRGFHATQATATSRPVLSARYNVLERTDQPANAYWTKTNSSVVGNAVFETSLTGFFGISRLNPNQSMQVPAGVAAKFSAKVKANGRNFCLLFEGLGGRYFDITPGSSGAVLGGYNANTPQATITPLEDDWFLCEIIYPSPATWHPQIYVSDTGARISYAGDPAKGILVTDIDLRPANQASLPYQRVNTATDYDTAGFPQYLRFDGVDDWLVTNTITPGTDKAQVFAGVRKLSDAAFGSLVELSSNYNINMGGFSVNVPDGANTRFSAAVSNAGIPYNYAYYTDSAAPLTTVNTVTLDKALSSGEVTAIRKNGADQSLTRQLNGNTTGNFLAYPLYIGRRGGTTFPFNGHLYSLIVRFGSNLPAATIEKTEKYINTKTRAY